MSEYLPPRKNFFLKVLFCAVSVFTARKELFRKVFFFFFLMFVGALSLERLDGSQPNFHTRCGVVDWLESY